MTTADIPLAEQIAAVREAANRAMNIAANSAPKIQDSWRLHSKQLHAALATLEDIDAVNKEHGR